MKESVTAFQQRVYDRCCEIPKGRVCTYAELAKSIECASAQAVGQALKRNPFAPEVPCHRVISATRQLHGYNGQTEGDELTRKRSLLESEGLRFEADGRIADKQFHHFA